MNLNQNRTFKSQALQNTTESYLKPLITPSGGNKTVGNWGNYRNYKQKLKKESDNGSMSRHRRQETRTWKDSWRGWQDQTVVRDRETHTLNSWGWWETGGNHQESRRTIRQVTWCEELPFKIKVMRQTSGKSPEMDEWLRHNLNMAPNVTNTHAYMCFGALDGKQNQDLCIFDTKMIKNGSVRCFSKASQAWWLIWSQFRCFEHPSTNHPWAQSTPKVSPQHSSYAYRSHWLSPPWINDLSLPDKNGIFYLPLDVLLWKYKIIPLYYMMGEKMTQI